MESIREGAAHVLDRMAQAAERSGRKGEKIRLVAVGKTKPAEMIGEAIEAGLSVFGENYVQEAEEKIRAYPQAEWHFIGKLQRNKVKKAVSLFSWIQTVDSLELLKEISRRAGEAGKVLPVLAEVNLAEEASKAGMEPEALAELIEAAPGLPGISLKGLMAIPPWTEDPEESRPYFIRLRELLAECASRGGAGAGMEPEALAELIEAAPGLPGIRLKGLMAIPPWTEDPEESRPYFIRLRELLAECASRGGAGNQMTELSMGMSNDFEAAIEEGATMVRVGTAIFGSRVRRAT